MESHVLSVDVEDWFQVENYAHAIRRDEWPRCELRVADNVHRLLDLLAGTNARGTFFVLGWVAERLPELVRDIARAGHEIASHGWSHTPIHTLGEAAFFDEVSRSRTLLEQLSGQPVIGYRAPTFSVTRRSLWALRQLRRAGYRYDRLWSGDSGPYASNFDPSRHSAELTWRNSEFSLVRLQLSHDEPRQDRTDNAVYVQYQVSLGAHGAHKF